MRRDIARAQALLADITGEAPRFFRATAGLRNPFPRPGAAWPGAARSPPGRAARTTRAPAIPNGCCGASRSHLGPGDIVLMHDGHCRPHAGRRACHPRGAAALCCRPSTERQLQPVTLTPSPVTHEPPIRPDGWSTKPARPSSPAGVSPTTTRAASSATTASSMRCCAGGCCLRAGPRVGVTSTWAAARAACLPGCWPRAGCTTRATGPPAGRHRRRPRKSCAASNSCSATWTAPRAPSAHSTRWCGWSRAT